MFLCFTHTNTQTHRFSPFCLCLVSRLTFIQRTQRFSFHFLPPLSKIASLPLNPSIIHSVNPNFFSPHSALHLFLICPCLVFVWLYFLFRLLFAYSTFVLFRASIFFPHIIHNNTFPSFSPPCFSLTGNQTLPCTHTSLPPFLFLSFCLFSLFVQGPFNEVSLLSGLNRLLSIQSAHTHIRSDVSKNVKNPQTHKHASKSTHGSL